MILKGCPNQDELSDFVLGKLDGGQVALVADHVDQCSACAHALNQVSVESDEIAMALAQLPYADKYGDELRAKEASESTDNIGRKPTLPAIAREAPARRFIRDYELLEKIGEGGMGVVYRARHTRLKREVALKLLTTNHPQDSEAVLRFEREVEAVGKLVHPNIVAALDAGEMDGTHYLAMELLEGVDVAELLRRHRRLSVADACELIRQAATGLQRAHESGMVHRDLKPSNLILTREEFSSPSHQASNHIETIPTVKILDMGLAQFVGPFSASEKELTSTSQVMGTLAYMAPEQSESSRSVDIRADIYSLGATLYKLLSGSTPFSTERYNTPTKMMRALVLEDPPSIRSLRSDLPAELAAVIDRMLAKDPANRYELPQQVAAALTPFAGQHKLGLLLTPSTSQNVAEELNSADLPVSRAASPQPQASPGRGRSIPRSATITAIVAAVLLLLAGIIVIIRDRDGNIIARLVVPKGGRVEVRDDGNASAKDNTKSKTRKNKSAQAERPPQRVVWTPTAAQREFVDGARGLKPLRRMKYVGDRLRAVNPDHKPTLKHEIAGGKIVKLTIRNGWYPDLWPLAALTNLKSLDARITAKTDLSPLSTLSLEHLKGVTISPQTRRAIVLSMSLPDLTSINGIAPSAWLARWGQVSKLALVPPIAGDWFGESLSVSGDTVIVSSSRRLRAGAAFVFMRRDGDWTQTAELRASDGAEKDDFGASISISGDTVLVGSPGDADAGHRSGSVYVFARKSGSWTQRAKLVASDATLGDLFGTCVAIDGDTAVVAAPGDDVHGSESGSVYIFTRKGPRWTEQAKLTASDAAAGDIFGGGGGVCHAVSISGDTVVVGAWKANAESGSAYVFTRRGVTWTQQAKLTASDRSIGFFGLSVSVDRDTVLIGAAQKDSIAGAAYVFTRTGTTWTQQAKLVASDAAAKKAFGNSVSVRGDGAVVAAANDDEFAGAVYVFRRRGKSWTEESKLTAEGTARGDQFGSTVALGDEMLVIGAWQYVSRGAGKAYIFQPNQAPR